LENIRQSYKSSAPHHELDRKEKTLYTLQWTGCKSTNLEHHTLTGLIDYFEESTVGVYSF
jgi:hypothetical protein